MSLARTSLPIDKECSIVAVEDVHDERECCLFKYFKLGAVRAEHGSEDVIFLRFFRPDVQGDHLGLILNESDATCLILF